MNAVKDAVTAILSAEQKQPPPIQLFLFKRLSFSDANKAITIGSVCYVPRYDGDFYPRGYAHEVGHALLLSRRNIPPRPVGFNHDAEPWPAEFKRLGLPANEGGLMKEDFPLNTWLRELDWVFANTRANGL